MDGVSHSINPLFERIGWITDSVIHSLTQSNDLFLIESAVWMNGLNLNDSLINSHFLPPTGGINDRLMTDDYISKTMH